MWTLLNIELFKIFKKPRTYISFGAIAGMILIIQLGLKFDGQSYLQLMMSGLTDSFFVPFDMILNGYLVAFVILNTLLIHVPLLIALVAGDAVAGEANMGTLRLIVCKPVSRTKLMLSTVCRVRHLHHYVAYLDGLSRVVFKCRILRH